MARGRWQFWGSIATQAILYVILSDSEESRNRKETSMQLSKTNQYFVYIVTNRRKTTLYAGMTNDLHRRMYEHKNGLTKGFSKRYNLTNLMYYEETTSVEATIAREKEIKGWVRRKKVALIEGFNPRWEDLSREWFDFC